MYVLGNPILGKAFRRFGLALNESGLHKVVRVDDPKSGRTEHRFFLTDDIHKILELLNIKLDDISTTISEDAYAHLMGCPHIQLNMFMGNEPEKSKELESFRQFLNNQSALGVEITDEVEPIRTARVEEVLGIELRDRIDSTRLILAEFPKVYKPKFEAMKVLLLKGGYVPQNFSKDLPKFNESFGGQFNYMEGFVNSTAEELCERYLILTQ